MFTWIALATEEFVRSPLPPTVSILAGADWAAILWAFAWAAGISLANIRRERAAQERAGQEVTPLTAVIPEAFLGAAFGLFLSIVVPDLWPKVRTLAGVTGLAMLGGFLGPRGWLIVSSIAESQARKRAGLEAPKSDP